MQHLRLREGIGTRRRGELENFRQPGSFAQKPKLTTKDTKDHEVKTQKDFKICVFLGALCGEGFYSLARDSKRVLRLMNARSTLPVGPLRCLAMINSARPSRSGSSGL